MQKQTYRCADGAPLPVRKTLAPLPQNAPLEFFVAVRAGRARHLPPGPQAPASGVFWDFRAVCGRKCALVCVAGAVFARGLDALVFGPREARTFAAPSTVAKVSKNAFSAFEDPEVRSVILGPRVRRISGHALACCPRLLRAEFRGELRVFGSNSEKASCGGE